MTPVWHGCRYQLIKYFPHRARCAEIGVQLGRFSHIILTRTWPRECILIDPWLEQDPEEYTDVDNEPQDVQDWRYDFVRRRFTPLIRNGIVSLRRGMSADELAKIPDNYLDWIYIDGNHSYKCVTEDLDESYRIVKPGGLIAGHDFFYDKESKNWGVIPAVMGFLAKHEELELLCVTDEGRPTYVIGEKGRVFPPVESK